MSVERTRAVMMRYLEAHDESMLDPEAVFTIMGTGKVARGREAIRQLVNSFYHGVFEAQYELKICSLPRVKRVLRQNWSVGK